MNRVAYLSALAFCWLAMLSAGSILVETLLLYPNIFDDVPASLAESMRFLSAVSPGDVFPVLGAATLVAGLVTVAVVWRNPGARYRAGAAVLAFMAGNFLFSVLFFWPRNTIMFIEGLEVHSAEYLRAVAGQFQAGHWVRVVLAAVTSVLAFAGFLKVHDRRARGPVPTQEHGASTQVRSATGRVRAE